MTDKYTYDDALNDLHYIEPVRDFNPEKASAFMRLERWLLGLKQSKPVPAAPACDNCIFLYSRDMTCSNAEVVERNAPQLRPASCDLRVPFKRGDS